MGWGYSELSIIVGLGLMAYTLIGATLVTVPRKNWLFFLSLSLLLLHSLMLGALFSNSSKLGYGRFGFEAWVCGSSVGLRADSQLSGYLNKGKSVLGDRAVIVRGSEDSYSAQESLASVGAVIKSHSVSLPISDSFEFELGANGDLRNFKDMVQYSGESGEPGILVEDQKTSCTGQKNSSWNVYVARVDAKTKSFEWEARSLSDFSTDRVRLSLSERSKESAGDCVLMEYGVKRAAPEHSCYSLLSNGYSLCRDSFCMSGGLEK